MNRRVPILVATIAMVVALAGAAWSTALAATPSELFFSEYIEGSSNNKALEIYNGTGATIDLAAGGYNVQMYFNGSASASLTINLTGVVAPGDVFVLAQSSANATILAQADQTNGAGWFNGDDAVVLRKGTTVIDAIGQIGFDPGSEWGSGLTSTADNTLRRKATICAGDPNGSDVFDPSVEWEGFATDTFDGLGSHTAACAGPDAAPAVISTYPVVGAMDFPFRDNLTVTFSEPVNADPATFTLTCGSDELDFTVSGGPETFTIDPEGDLPTGTPCTLTVSAANITDQDTNDPPDTMDADVVVNFTPFDVCAVAFTPIFDIQGSGAAAAITGIVTTQGVVVGDYEGSSPALRGFYMQDVTGDGNSATSDAIFVFNGNNNNVNLGDVVRVTGTAGEFQDQTQISASSVTNCGTGSVQPFDVTLPTAAADTLEQYEGMLVRFPQPLYVTEHFQLGRFGQVVVTSQPDRQWVSTHVAAPGAAANAVAAANSLNRIIIDDELNNQNPDPISFGRNGQPLSASNTLRGGDAVTGAVGIMTYTWAGNSASGNAYRLRPISALGGFVEFTGADRPLGPEPVAGALKVAAFNLLNYFNTFDGLPDTLDNCTNGVGGAATDCRGADTQDEFDRQWPKTVSAVTGLGADVIGLIEIENDGYGADSALQDLVTKVNTATAPGTYALIDVDAATGQINALGTDAIKVALIYKPASVTPVGQTAALNTEAFVNAGDSGPRNRPALAQTFQENSTGQRFTVVVNHLKSKGSACDALDAGDGQGNCSIVRTIAANELVTWLAADPTGAGDGDVLIVGDLNSYAMEDPITAIKNTGFTDLLNFFGGAAAYGYVFDGAWGYLDHALASSPMLSQIKGVTEWHINADEPNVLDYNTNFKSAGQVVSLYAPDEFRTSDHDPVLVGVCLTPPIAVNVTPNVLWPPNHKYVKVTASVVTAPDATLSVTVTSSEPDNGLGDGDTPNDIQQLSPNQFNLRAERAGGGPGRVYTVTYTATRACGTSATGVAQVLVPANQGKGNREGDAVTVERAVDALFMANRLFLPAVTR